jgi:hypothetical protein
VWFPSTPFSFDLDPQPGPDGTRKFDVLGHTPGDDIIHVPLGVGERLESADAPIEVRILAHAVELVTLG